MKGVVSLFILPVCSICASPAFAGEGGGRSGPPAGTTVCARQGNQFTFQVDVPLEELKGVDPGRIAIRPVEKNRDGGPETFLAFPILKGKTGSRSTVDGKSLPIVGRYRGEGRALLHLVALPGRGESARIMKSLPVHLSANPPEDGEAVRTWARAAARDLYRQILTFERGETGFQRHALWRMMTRFNLFAEDFPNIWDGEDRFGNDLDRNVNLYSVTTGALAIEESLQLGVGLGIGAGDDSGTAGVEIDTLRGPGIRSHPFEQMLKGRSPPVEKTAALVPEDGWYLHFSSIQSEIRLMDFLDQWGTSFLQAVEVSSRDRKLKEKLLEQLAIDISILTRLFGELVIGEIALTGSDPFLHDGSDVALILEVKNKTIFELQMSRYRNDARLKNPDAREAAREYEGVSISSLVTPDRRISSHLCNLGEFRVYANSLQGLKRIIDARAGRVPVLSGGRDFLYLRTIFPPGRENEDGFLYLSDSFIRNVVGPRQKIGRLRQMRCIANLRAIQFGALECALERGETSSGKLPGLEALLGDGFVGEGEARCPSGGSYSLQRAGNRVEAVCSIHNRLLLGTPLIEIPAGSVTGSEEKGYRMFVQNYERYWSQYFDPIGIRMRIPGDQEVRLEAETCILPLIENSIYNGLRTFLEGEPLPLSLPSLPRAIGSLSITLPEREKILQILEKSFFIEDGVLSSLELKSLLELLVGGLTITVHDGEPLFFISGEGMELLGFGSGEIIGEAVLIGTILTSFTLPVSLSAEVKSPEEARAWFNRFIPRLEALVNRRRDPFPGDSVLFHDSSLGPYKGIPLNLVSLRFFLMNLYLYHAIIDRHLVVATQRWILTEAIDRYTSRKKAEPVMGPPPIEEEDLQKNLAHFLLQLQPPEYRRILPILGAHWQDQMRMACYANFPALHLFLNRMGREPGRIQEECLGIFGYVPFCPAGGTYGLDRVSGTVRCSVHRGPDDPTQPLEARGDEPFLNFLESLKMVRASFRLTDEGIRTRVLIK